MNRNLVIILAIILLIGGWFFISPLFIDRSVDESFEFVAANGEIDVSAVTAMPADERLAMMPEIMDAAANAPDRRISDEMPSTGPRAIASGQFVDADTIHKGSGEATIYDVGGGDYVVRFEDFRTTNGPALVVYLAKHPAPTEARHVKEGGYLSLGRLKGNVGNQNYAVPGQTDLNEYNSVVIWCELFGVLFSPAALTPVEESIVEP